MENTALVTFFKAQTASIWSASVGSGPAECRETIRSLPSSGKRFWPAGCPRTAVESTGSTTRGGSRRRTVCLFDNVENGELKMRQYRAASGASSSPQRVEIRAKVEHLLRDAGVDVF